MGSPKKGNADFQYRVVYSHHQWRDGEWVKTNSVRSQTYTSWPALVAANERWMRPLPEDGDRLRSHGVPYVKRVAAIQWRQLPEWSDFEWE